MIPALRARVWPFVGATLAIHFGLVCWIKGRSSSPEEIWWLSHFSLGVTSAALLTRSARLASVALVLILIPHALWLIDCAGLYALGRSPMGITAYLRDADAWGWVGTAHHFYLIPLLAFVLRSERAFTLRALPMAAGLLVLLTIVSRVGLPPASNVNYAFAVLPGVQLGPVVWCNGLPAPLYLLVINAWVVVTMFLPSSLVLRAVAGRRRRSAARPA